MATVAARSGGGARRRYSGVAMVLHWTIALLIIGNLLAGLWLFDVISDYDKQLYFTSIQLHKSIGLTVLVLSVARLLWRLANPPPALPAHLTPAEHLLAKSTHWGFYGLMLALPLTGWAMSSTGALLFPILWFGLFEVPHLPLPTGWNGVLGESHEILGWLAVAMIALHVAAALKHQYLDRDDIFARMIPWLKGRAT